MEFHADERILFETAHSILIMMVVGRWYKSWVVGVGVGVSNITN